MHKYTTRRPMWESNPGLQHSESDALPSGHHAPHIQNLLLLILSSYVTIHPIPEKQASMTQWLCHSPCKPASPVSPMRLYTDVPSPYDLSCWWDVKPTIPEKKPADRF